LKDYLDTLNLSEILACYQDLEEIGRLTEEQIGTRLTALVWRCKSQFDAVHNKSSPQRVKTAEGIVWNCLGKLRRIEEGHFSIDDIDSLISIAQEDLLSHLMAYFEGFLNSHFFKAWQEMQTNLDRERKNNTVSFNSSKQYSIGSPTHATSVSGRSESRSDFPSIGLQSNVTSSGVLIVDDSVVTLKLAKLSLESDGHTVDKAMNGQIALDMLKERSYDVVLIDLNMPVMDGFETVRLFREHEALVADEELSTNGWNPADDGELSDLSDDDAQKSHFASVIPRDVPPSTTRLDRPHHLSVHRSRHRKTGRFGQLIIGMSTNVDNETRQKALSAGMDYFLPKPFTLQKFADILKTSMQHQYQENTVPSSDLVSQSSNFSIPQKMSNELYEP
jgi:CheY-like chemotaxis protein